MRWFRFYTDALDDAKVQQLSPPLFKFWLNLLCLAARREQNGDLPLVESIAFSVRMSQQKVDKFVASLINCRLIDESESRLSIHNWALRQPASDSSRDRVRASRDRHGDRYKAVTVTPQNRTEENRTHTQENRPVTVTGRVGVSAKPKTIPPRPPVDMSMEELRGPPFDIVKACDEYLGRCLWDWFPALQRMKAQYSGEELQHGFEEAHKRRGRTPRYVESVIEGSRIHTDGASPGGSAAGSGFAAFSVAEYRKLTTEAAGS